MLIQVGLWPADSTEKSALYQANPYELHAKAVEERLSLHQIGRVLLHLNQRPGFLSNRKDRSDREVQGMLAEINENEAERIAGNFAIIGDWLADGAFLGLNSW